MYTRFRGVYSQEFAKGDTKGVWGTEVPQRGPGQRSGGGLGRNMLNFQLNIAIDRQKSRTVQSRRLHFEKFPATTVGGHAPMSPVGYTTDYLTRLNE